MITPIALALALNTATTGDVLARVAGNDRESGTAIARSVFSRIEPAQVTKISVFHVTSHRVAGILVSGVKFHHSLNRSDFSDEIVSLITQSFAHSAVEEVDVRTVVPVSVGRGTAVSGDNASPSFRDVFTVTALRGEAPAQLRQRIDRADGVFWDAWFLRQLQTSAR